MASHHSAFYWKKLNMGFVNSPHFQNDTSAYILNELMNCGRGKFAINLTQFLKFSFFLLIFLLTLSKI